MCKIAPLRTSFETYRLSQYESDWSCLLRDANDPRSWTRLHSIPASSKPSRRAHASEEESKSASNLPAGIVYLSSSLVSTTSTCRMRLWRLMRRNSNPLTSDVGSAARKHRTPARLFAPGVSHIACRRSVICSQRCDTQTVIEPCVLLCKHAKDTKHAHCTFCASCIQHASFSRRCVQLSGNEGGAAAVTAQAAAMAATYCALLAVMSFLIIQIIPA
jgi:hypothetical protein